MCYFFISISVQVRCFFINIAFPLIWLCESLFLVLCAQARLEEKLDQGVGEMGNRARAVRLLQRQRGTRTLAVKGEQNKKHLKHCSKIKMPRSIVS